MANACVKTDYFSGQGALLLADRDGSGDPTGFLPVGNIPELVIAVETTVFEHKESCTGIRGLDLEVPQEIKVTANFTIESINKENLALALYGSSSAIVAGSVTDEAQITYLDKWTALDNIKVNTVVVTNVGGATTYVEGTDYVVNLEAGSIKPLSTGSMVDLATMEIDYSYANQDDIQTIESSVAPLKVARFEGLNTADTNKAIVVEIFKMSIKPLAELALINEEIAQMAIETTILLDDTKVSGSQYFTIRKIA